MKQCQHTLKKEQVTLNIQIDLSKTLRNKSLQKVGTQTKKKVLPKSPQALSKPHYPLACTPAGEDRKRNSVDIMTNLECNSLISDFNLAKQKKQKRVGPKRDVTDSPLIKKGSSKKVTKKTIFSNQMLKSKELY